MVLLNILAAAPTKVAAESPLSVSVADIVWLILVFLYTVHFCVYAIETVKETIKSENDWSKKPIPAAIQQVAKGMIGLITVGFVIYALINWSSCTITEWLAFCVFAPVLGIGLVFVSAIVFMFGYYFLYKPFAALISCFKKKE